MKIGDKVVCIRGAVWKDQQLLKDQIYTVLDIVKHSCGYGIYVGLSFNKKVRVRCDKCNSVIEQSKRWIHSMNRFRLLDEVLDEIEIEEVFELPLDLTSQMYLNLCTHPKTQEVLRSI